MRFSSRVSTFLVLASLTPIANAADAGPVYPKIKFTYTAADIKATCAKVLAKAKKRVEVLAKIDDDSRTFKNTVVALENIQHDIYEGLGPIFFLSETSPSPTVQDAANVCNTNTSNFSVQTFARPDLSHALD